MNVKVQAIYKETVQQLAEIYERAEAESLTNLLFEDFLQIPKTQRLTNPQISLTDEQKKRIESALEDLRNHKPIQQIIGYCFFYGQKFQVNQHTLIPRPETEELVDLICSDHKGKKVKILDIGTGTGCIAISLAATLPGSEAYAWDISPGALETAKKNAKMNQVTINFELADVLTHSERRVFDVIVSNPPYIPFAEKKVMARNVTQYEPEKALFVPDDDPLLFYRKIGELGRTNLSAGGKLYFEIHENFGAEVCLLLKNLNYQHVTTFKDMQGKDRMIRAEMLSPA